MNEIQHVLKLLQPQSTLCSFQGIKNADENELKQIASDPDDTHAYNVADFAFLDHIVGDLTTNLCNSVRGSGMFSFSILFPSFKIKIVFKSLAAQPNLTCTGATGLSVLCCIQCKIGARQSSPWNIFPLAPCQAPA